MSSAGGNLVGDLGWRDVLSVGRDLVGGYFDNRQGDRDRAARAGETEADRQLRREQSFMNTSGPTGSVNYSGVDPATGLRTRTHTLKPEDQQRLDQYRQLILGSQGRQAAQPTTDFDALRNQYSSQSFGGQYVTPDRYTGLGRRT